MRNVHILLVAISLLIKIKLAIQTLSLSPSHIETTPGIVHFDSGGRHFSQKPAIDNGDDEICASFPPSGKHAKNYNFQSEKAKTCSVATDKAPTSPVHTFPIEEEVQKALLST